MSSNNHSHKYRSLLLLIVDVTPSYWGERESLRSRQDLSRRKIGKRSIGPATLDEVLLSLLSFSSAFASLQRENCLIVIGVADSEIDIVYPRETILNEIMTLNNVEIGSSINPRELYESIMLGIGKLVDNCSKRAEDLAYQAELLTSKSNNYPSYLSINGAALTAAISMALCIINRYAIAFKDDVSDLNHRREISQYHANRERLGGKIRNIKSYYTIDDNDNLDRTNRFDARILIIQVSEDRKQDYNSFMNCVFAALEENIVIDGCFIPSGIINRARTSTFLEQACDKTGGVFSKPTGFSQVSGGFTEILMTVFLPSIAVRKWLNLPMLNEVDFRARCFKTGKSISLGYVCNRCFSIFETCPKKFCFICGAKIELQKNNRIKNI